MNVKHSFPSCLEHGIPKDDVQIGGSQMRALSLVFNMLPSWLWPHITDTSCLPFYYYMNIKPFVVTQLALSNPHYLTFKFIGDWLIGTGKGTHMVHGSFILNLFCSHPGLHVRSFQVICYQTPSVGATVYHNSYFIGSVSLLPEDGLSNVSDG